MSRSITIEIKADTRQLRASLLEAELSLTRGILRTWNIRRKLRKVKRETAP